MKVWNYIFIMVGIIILLEIFGFDTAVDGVFNLIGLSINNGKITNVEITASSFYDRFFSSGTGILTLAAIASGIIVSFFTRSKPENFVLLPLITTTLVLFVSTFYSIIKQAIAIGDQWVIIILSVIFIPFTIGYILALAEFFRGTD